MQCSNTRGVLIFQLFAKTAQSYQQLDGSSTEEDSRPSSSLQLQCQRSQTSLPSQVPWPAKPDDTWSSTHSSASAGQPIAGSANENVRDTRLYIFVCYICISSIDINNQVY